MGVLIGLQKALLEKFLIKVEKIIINLAARKSKKKKVVSNSGLEGLIKTFWKQKALTK